ncbi:MAG: FxsA family protein [Hyphomicrobium sp.]|nr:FxsA family protein [Hyphomicrobium sp.]
MPIVLSLALLAYPIAEIALFITVGQAIGLLPTLLIIVITAIVGMLVIRQQGFAGMEKVGRDLRAGRPPVDAMADSVLTILAGLFLVAPGLLTDVAGLLLLLPPVRAFVRRAVGSDVHVDVRVFGDDGGRIEPRTPTGARTSAEGQTNGTVIEGEFERMDETSVDSRRR